MTEISNKFNDSLILQGINETRTCYDFSECHMLFIGIKNLGQLFKSYYLPIFTSKHNFINSKTERIISVLIRIKFNSNKD